MPFLNASSSPWLPSAQGCAGGRLDRCTIGRIGKAGRKKAGGEPGNHLKDVLAIPQGLWDGLMQQHPYLGFQGKSLSIWALWGYLPLSSRLGFFRTLPWLHWLVYRLSTILSESGRPKRQSALPLRNYCTMRRSGRRLQIFGGITLPRF